MIYRGLIPKRICTGTHAGRKFIKASERRDRNTGAGETGKPERGKMKSPEGIEKIQERSIDQ